MKEEQYSTLWVLAPLCAALVILTGGMLFLGWFATDFSLSLHAPILIAAFATTVFLAAAIVGGYIACLKRRISPEKLRLALTALLATFLTVLTVICLIDGFSGSTSSFVLGAMIGLLATVFWLTIKCRRFRS